MSGGSMNHLYHKVSSAEFEQNTLERRAFYDHLHLVAMALHDIEWVDSGDYVPGDETEAILACLQPGATLAALVQEATALVAQLQAEIEAAGGPKVPKKRKANGMSLQTVTRPGETPVICIPCLEGEYPIYANDVQVLAELFPAVDVEQTLREIRAWNLATPDRRKTVKGVRRHITSWMTKEQNK